MRNCKTWGFGQQRRSKNNSYYHTSLLQRPFVCSGATECCHSPSAIFTQDNILWALQRGPFASFSCGLAQAELSGEGNSQNPNVDAQLGRLSMECPDQTKAGREIQPFIYIHCGFACCVLDFQTPGGYSVWGRRQMDAFPFTYLKEPSELMSDPYVLI